MTRSNATSDDALARMRLQVSVCIRSKQTIVASKVFEPGSWVTLGRRANASLAFREWGGPDLLLISNGSLLHLEPGMRVDMCDDGGGGRVKGTFEELHEIGIETPIRVRVCKLNIGVRDGISVFARFLAEGEAPRKVPGQMLRIIRRALLRIRERFPE